MTISTTFSLSRRHLLAGTAVVALAAACSGGDDADDSSRSGRSGDVDDPQSSARSRSQSRSPLTLRGINLDTDRDPWIPGHLPRTIESIANDLHCNAILLLGSDLDRLKQSAAVAADNGLHVWFEPRHFDSNATETAEFVAEVARAAEEIRRDHPDVGLSLGVELTIFMDGLVPGSSWDERGESLGVVDPASYNGKLNDFLASTLSTVRPIFDGQLTYSSGTWEEVDWTDFDIVGVDLYRDSSNEATFADEVRALHRHGKPVVITEFGCCSFVGADDMGGMGFTVIDWTAADPTVAPGTVRDEQVQAGYIEELLDVFEAERLHGAFIYDFIEPDAPYSPDPLRDFDMACFAVVKCFPSGHDKAYDTTGHFEPKAAFHAIADRFG